ncbi:MAG: hypothetical protein AB8C84_09600 [Oligoflexales bacterium]
MKTEEYSIDGQVLRIEHQERAGITARAFGSHVLISKGNFGFAGEIQGVYLYRMMLECVAQRWTGVFYFYAPDGKKAVYFRCGEIVFATSEVMEDRLGEVLFRQGRLSIETQMDCAVRVTKDKRFGEVLIQSSVFDHSELLESLALQVRQIVQSFFQYPVVCVEVIDQIRAPQEIVLLEGTKSVLDAAWGDGVVLQSFVERVLPDEAFEITGIPGVTATGTFLGDFLEILQGAPAPRDLLVASRLGAVRTWVALLNVIARGWVRPPILNPSQNIVKNQGLFDVFKQYQDSVGFVLERSDDLNWVEPLREHAFSLNCSMQSLPCLFLNDSGYLDSVSVDHMMIQAEHLTVHVAAFQRRVTFLLHLLQQMSGVSFLSTQDRYETQKLEKITPDELKNLYPR